MSPHRHWVSLQDGVDLSEVEQLALLQVADLCPDGVQSGSCVTLRRHRSKVRVSNNASCVWGVGVRYLREDESIIVGVAWVFRAILHGVEEEHRHDLCRAAT